MSSLKPTLSFTENLYCSEEQWKEQEDEEVTSNVGFEISDFFDINVTKNSYEKNPYFDLSEQDLYWEEQELVSLFSKEPGNRHDLFKILESNPDLAKSRFESVEWMLKVNAFYSFSALTALLAIDYFDRFIFSFHFHEEQPWMTHLASVACLSLAAKVEETDVPLLLDFQVEETKYVFEAKTIQRMEILVSSTLQWRMNPVTPISFIDFTIRRLGFKNQFCWKFFSKCQSIILSLLSDERFMCFLPSELAAATMFHAIGSVEPYILAEHQNQILGVLQIDKEKMDKCSEFILESTIRCYVNSWNKRKLTSMPGSPNGVMDMSFSTESSIDSWVTTSSVSSSPEPLSKKIKVQDLKETR